MLLDAQLLLMSHHPTIAHIFSQQIPFCLFHSAKNGCHQKSTTCSLVFRFPARLKYQFEQSRTIILCLEACCLRGSSLCANDKWFIWEYSNRYQKCTKECNSGYKQILALNYWSSWALCYHHANICMWMCQSVIQHKLWCYH